MNLIIQNKLSKILILFFFFNINICLALDNEAIENNSQFTQDLIPFIDDFIDLPEGGIPWEIFGKTEMIEYDFTDKDGNDWVGYRPKFKNEIKKLESKEIIVQGYMFPLDQGDKQSLFLLGPFPLSCPYHPHTQSNLLIEVHASKPVFFSYDAINIQGELELVPKDDEYNMFYRLKNAKRIKN